MGGERNKFEITHKELHIRKGIYKKIRMVSQSSSSNIVKYKDTHYIAAQ